MKPFIRSVPRPRLAHRQNNLTRAPIHAEKIDDGRIGDAGRSRFLLMILIVLLILRHWAE